MERRLRLHKSLLDLLNSKQVYFQPPETVKISYPCIIYHLNDIQIKNADDINYVNRKRYTVTYITRDPDDSLILDIVNNYEYCTFDRWYTSDNLHHYVYDLYY